MSKILIIEDEVAIADLEKDYLELSDFKVDICNTGDEGLKTALAGDYDLIILDLMLPGMDGFEVCKKIREEKNIPILMVSAKKDDIDKIRGLGLGADDYMTKPFSPSELVARVKAHMARYERLVGTNQKQQNDIVKIREEKNIPILMVSAKKDDIDKIRGLGLGADDYMTKPFSPSELVARVKAHMARYERLVGTNQKQQNDIVEIRGIRIDKTARRVYVDGVEKTFTTKEFDLLTFLAEHPNHVFTKEELFREIWDMDSIGDIATVTVHIKKIREKIEKDTAKPQYIETIWGVGYRFKV